MIFIEHFCDGRTPKKILLGGCLENLICSSLYLNLRLPWVSLDYIKQVAMSEEKTLSRIFLDKRKLANRLFIISPILINAERLIRSVR